MSNSSLPVQQAAKILGVSTKTLRRWEGRGVLIPQRTIGNHRRYTEEQVLKFKEAKDAKGKISQLLSPRTSDFENLGPIENLKFRIENFSLLHPSKKKFIAFLAIFFVFFVTSLGVLGFKLFNDSQQPKFGQELSLVKEEGSVLAESTGKLKLSGSVGFNIPAFFNDLVTFKKDVKIENQDLDLGTGKLTASNVLYGARAGSGIAVGTGQTPTITNTGVLSLGGSTGALSLTAGSGISISGLTITNSDTGSSQKIFKTVKVGSTTFDAGSNTSTLEFAAGTGMSISADTSNKKLTLSASAADLNASGWTDDGTTVRLSTSTDNVGIGTTNPSYKLDVNGSLGVGSTAYFASSVGIGTSSPTVALDVSGSAAVSGTLTVSGSLVTTGSQSGFWQRTSGSLAPTNISDALNLGNTATSSALVHFSGTSGGNSWINTGGNVGIGTTNPTSALYVDGATVIAPSTDGTTTSLTVRAANGSTGNVLDITSTAGSTSYLSIDNNGNLTVGGSTLTNAGLLESSGAIHLTGSTNTIVGTAIEGGWTMNSNTFSYRRTITVQNNDGSNALPTNYEITVSLSGTTASNIYSNTQSDGDDFRIAYYDGSNYNEISRNITTYSSSSIVFTFQLQAAIAASSSSSAYYIYYKNSSLSCSSCTYTGNTQLDSADDVSNWTSGDDGYVLSQETTIKQEGTGSVKAVAANGNIGVGTTASQGQLVQSLTGHSTVKASISSTDYVYTLGGNNGSSDQTTVYKATIDGSGNIGVGSTASQGQLPQALSGLAVVVPAVTTFDGGTGADGTLDLSLGSGAGGCNGTGLSWSGSTCTIATATKSTFNFTTINISSGTTLTTDGPQTTSNFVTIKATGNVTVAGTIDLNEKGYQQRYGPGVGGDGVSFYAEKSGGGGGGYGGTGGNDTFGRGVGGSTYVTEDSGSGGGRGVYYGAGGGGAGGGGVKITSGGNITVSGSINTNGGNGTGVSCSPLTTGGGGGSGGGIFLQGGNITNTGSITANGGNGGTPWQYCGEYNMGAGGGGGGGRITIEYTGSLTAGTITVTGGSGANSGSSGVSTQTSQAPNVYVLGGSNGGTAQSTVYKSSISGSDLGTFSTTNQTQLPQVLYGHSDSTFQISSNNYIYIIGGHNGTAAQTTVYKATIDSSGDISAISTTSQTQLDSALYYHGSATATISSTNYIYLVGGLNSSGTTQTTVYKATVDGSANVSAITSTGQGTLPVALSQPAVFTATTGSNTFLYVLGGKKSDGTPNTTVYKAALDSSGNVGTFSSTGQGALPQALYGHQAFVDTTDSTQYAYILGGTGSSGSPVSTVYRAQLNDMSSYTATRTISSTNLSNKNDLQWQYYSSATGSYMALEFSEDGSTWQTCSFSVSSASTWETQTCDISGIASSSRDAVTRLRFRVTSDQTSEVTSYFDDIDALTDADTISNTATGGSAVLGASDLALNAQGTGAVLLNYDATNGLAGTGGMKLYDGSSTLLFELTSSGDASASGSLVLRGTSPSTIDILNGNRLDIQTSVGGDAGLTPRLTLTNAGNLGIGTTAPSYKLEVNGSLGVGSTAYFASTVGIGTTSPGAALDIAGNLLVQGGGTIDVRSAGTLTIGGTTQTGLTLGRSGQSTTLVGNVQAFTLAGSITGSGSPDITGIGSFSGSSSTLSSTGVALNLSGAGTSISFSGAGLAQITTASNQHLALVPGGTGNVGIGTTNPGYKLDINGSLGVGSTAYFASTVGIGTTAPSATLDINGTLVVAGNTTATNTTQLSSLTLADGAGSCAANINDSTHAVFVEGAYVPLTSDIFYNSTRGKHARISNSTTCVDGGTTYRVLTLSDSITSQAASDTASVYTPLANLGNTTAGFFNNIYGINGSFVTSTVTGGFDIAESYPTVDSSMESGDVVAIDPSSTVNPQDTTLHSLLSIVKTSSPYQKEIIGVVSTNPGLTLGREEDQPEKGICWRKVALSGRVPVKVSTENGPVVAGDPLASSSTPGVAMKAIKAGPIIGKAMETYDGTGGSVCDLGGNGGNGNQFNQSAEGTDQSTPPPSCGKILTFVNLSWFDPGIYLTQDGNLLLSPVGSFNNTNDAGSLVSSPSATPSVSLEAGSTATFSAAIADLTGRLDSLTSRLELLQGLVLSAATSSAVFQETATSSASLIPNIENQSLNLEQATISGNLLVSGRTILSDLGVTGDISAGILTVNGLEGEINTLVGDLRLQSNGFGGVDILAGKVVIDKEGNIITQGEVTAKKINVDSTDEKSASLGSGLVIKGKTSVVIETTAVTSASRIFVTPTSKTGKQPLVVSKKSVGSGFTVSIEDPYSQDITFDWWVVN